MRNKKIGCKNEELKIIEALSKISQAITSDLYLDDILKLVVTITAETLGSKICSLMLINDKNELVIRATQSVSEEYIKKPPVKVGESIAGKVFINKTPVSVYDLQNDKDYKYKEIARKEGLRSLLAVPLIVKKKTIGVINVYTSVPHVFSKKEVNILTAVANQAAIVIENTELLVKTKVIAEELETRKLVERAKGLLMKNNGFCEDEAYKIIQKQAMDKRKTIKEIAEAILIVNDLR